MDVLSPFVLCHSDWLFHGESCPRLDVVHPGRAWSSSPACTWHCSLHYVVLQASTYWRPSVVSITACRCWHNHCGLPCCVVPVYTRNVDEVVYRRRLAPIMRRLILIAPVRPSVCCFVWMSYHCVSYFLARCNSVDFDRRLMSSGFRWSVAWPAFVGIITDNLLMSYGCQFYAAFKKYSDRINTRYAAEICGNVHSMEWA